ncbi:MAG: Rab family GTPase [Candidatus Hodarchaeales archaeon]
MKKLRVKEKAQKSEYLLKICVIGSGDVQKTEIIRKYAEDKFDGNYLPTLGVDITTKKVTINRTQTKLIIVDTAGQEFFGKLRPNYYRRASGALIFCNMYNRKSIESIPSWLEEFRNHKPSPNIPISIALVINQIGKIKNQPTKHLHPIPKRRKRAFLKIMKRILCSNKRKIKYRKKKKRKNKRAEIPKEWSNLSNSELVSHFALEYDLGICKVDIKNSRDISNCFTHIAHQVIKA